MSLRCSCVRKRFSSHVLFFEPFDHGIEAFDGRELFLYKLS